MINQETRRSLDNLLSNSFHDLTALLGDVSAYGIKTVDPDVIHRSKLHAVMFTISTSDFRLVLLLYFKRFIDLNAQTKGVFKDNSDEAKKYTDFICELGNNLCGSTCRALNATQIATGMSTPFILENHDSAKTITTIGADGQTHIGLVAGKDSILSSSMCMFVNKNQVVTLDIQPKEFSQTAEESGELEFF